MIFSSPAFLVFLPCVLLLYHTLRDRSRKYNVLLAASWVFYAWWSLAYVWVLLALTAIDYFAALKIRASEGRARKRWLLLSVVSNLGLLAAFKYSAFVLDNTLAGARLLGFEVPDWTLSIVLPLGISFHTFQGISYTVDVYRGTIPAVRSFRDYALFVAFFPQLVAGPVVRAVEFLPQMVTPPRVTAAHVMDGVHWFLLGLAKKLIIADWLDTFVSPVFLNPEQYSPGTLRWAMLGWAGQIYCDFSGYSDMAIGSALFFGFVLPRNFDFPYLAASITEFWRRWHISLSTWLRDYVYFPMGGSRGSGLRTSLNLMTLFVLCGLWHGATWKWLAFGALHGVMMVAHRQWTLATADSARWKRLRATLPYRAAATLCTFGLVTLTLVLVRAETWAAIGGVLGGALGLAAAGGTAWLPVWVPALLTLVLAGHLVSGTPATGERPCRWRDWPAPARALGYAGTVALLVLVGTGGAKPFVYFAF